MKKVWRMISLVLVFAMLLTVGVVAEEKHDSEKASITQVGLGATATFSENGEVITVTVTGEFIKAGKQHLVLMVKGTEDDYEIKQESILYIDQKAAAGEDPNASISFDVYPSEMATGVILIINEDGSTVAAIVEGRYVLGDVDNSGVVDIGDAVALLRYIAKLTNEINLNAANVDGSDSVDIGDAVKLLRVIARLETL